MRYPHHPRHCLVLVLALAVASAGFGQSIYTATKIRRFTQTANSGSAADPIAPFVFEADSPTAGITLAQPSNISTPLNIFYPDNTDYELNAAFATKAALDAAYPNGTYRMSGAGIPTLTFDLSTELYPVAPQVLNGTWSPGGMLVVNPAQSNTITFNTFSGYASAGVAGYMNIGVHGLSDNVSIDNEVATRPVFGTTASATPLTSVTIPANQLTSGRLYEGRVEFGTVTTLDTTSVAGGGAVAGFSSRLYYYIVAQTPGTTLPAAPVITTQPRDAAVAAGGRATFTVGATLPGGNYLSQWFFNGLEVGFPANPKYTFSADRLTLNVNNVTAADAGNYTLKLFNPGGVVISTAAALTIAPAGAPAIVQQPASATVAQGSTAVFSVGATGAVSYQWRLNGAAISGATGATLVVQNATAAQAGPYTVVVTGGAGSPVTSSAAALTVAANVTDPGRLINLSILTPLAAGETMTMGTVLGGDGTSGNKSLLARAAGPSLTQFNVTGFLPDPKMTLNYTSPSPVVVVATNNDWNGTAALSTAFASVGAFPYINATSKDAALFQQGLAPGNYTVQVSDAGTGTGTVIAELYDATAAGTFTAATPRLINVSVLKQIGTGSSLTAGFVIGGTTGKTVLIRAIGPALGLAPFNIGGVMPDPQLTVTNISATPSVTVAVNNDWGGAPAIAQTAARISAFAVANAASKDAMLLLTLAPGNYTAQVGPASGTAGGTAIVEVYEVP